LLFGRGGHRFAPNLFALVALSLPCPAVIVNR
jgi:hypothetical protein